MTTIKIEENKINVQGHSGYAEKGRDIVCAAISTLTEATYNYLKATGNNVVEMTKDGYLLMVIEEINESGKSIVLSFTDMVDDLVKQYPENIERI